MDLEYEIHNTVKMRDFASEKLRDIRHFSLWLRIESPDVWEEFESILDSFEDNAKTLYVESTRGLKEWERHFPEEYGKVMLDAHEDGETMRTIASNRLGLEE